MKRFTLGVVSTLLLIAVGWGCFYLYEYVNRPLDLVVYANAEELKAEINRLEKIKENGRLSWRESFRLGVSYHQSSDYNNAVIVLEGFVTNKKDVGKAYETLGMSYFRLKKLEDAVKNWQLAKQLSNDGRFLEQMILDVERTIAIQSRIKQLENEIKQIKDRAEIVAAGSKDGEPPVLVKEVSWEKVLELSLLYLGEEKFKEAVQHLEEAVSKKKDNADLYDSLAQAYAMTGDFKKAQGAIKKAVKLRPDDRELSLRLEEINKINKGIEKKDFHSNSLSK